MQPSGWPGASTGLWMGFVEADRVEPAAVWSEFNVSSSVPARATDGELSNRAERMTCSILDECIMRYAVDDVRRAYRDEKEGGAEETKGPAAAIDVDVVWNAPLSKTYSNNIEIKAYSLAERALRCPAAWPSHVVYIHDALDVVTARAVGIAGTRRCTPCTHEITDVDVDQLWKSSRTRVADDLFTTDRK